MRYALDILSILTVVPKTQLLLSEAVAVLDEGGSTVSSVGRFYQSVMLCIKTLLLVQISIQYVYTEVLCNI